MSSVAFPPGNGLEEQYYQPSFDTSSFQVNPLSSHPPRTPRPSMHASSSQNFSSITIYDHAPEADENTPEDENEDIEMEDKDKDEKVKNAGKKVRLEEILKEMIVTSNGRDKVFKLIQYTIKLGLWFHASTTGSRLLRRPTRPPWEQDIVSRLQSTASGLSLTRKLLLLFNWLHPLTQILSQQSVPFSTEISTEKAKKIEKPFLHTLLYAPTPVLLELVNAITDDLATWSKLGLFGKTFGERVGRLADWCWLLTTFVGLIENSVEIQINSDLHAQVQNRLYKESMTGATAKSKPKTSQMNEMELGRLRKQDYWLQIGRAKLAMDLIFVSYELFGIGYAKTLVQTIAGLASAILSSTKLYDRHKNALVKVIMTSS